MFDRAGNRKYVNARERVAFLKAAKADKALRVRTFCLTLYYCGCRISEALNVTKAHVDLVGKTITFETLKQRRRGSYRAVPIPVALTESLREILVDSNPEDRVWSFSRTTAYLLVKDCMATASIIGTMACPKGLRHGFAVACIAENIPLVTVQRWLGHGRLETTAI